MDTHGMLHIKSGYLMKAQLWLMQTKKEDVVRLEWTQMTEDSKGNIIKCFKYQVMKGIPLLHCITYCILLKKQKK